MFRYCSSVSLVLFLVGMLVLTTVATLVVTWLACLFCLRSSALLSCSRKCCGLFNWFFLLWWGCCVVVGRLCFVQSRLFRARFIRAVEVQNSDPVPMVGVSLFTPFGPANTGSEVRLLLTPQCQQDDRCDLSCLTAYRTCSR